MGNCISDYYLKKQSNELPIHSLKGNIYKAKIVDIYDGDTCTAVFYQYGKFRKYKIRMNGYDSPEMKPSLKKENRSIEIENAKEAKLQIENKILNKIVTLECGDFDKYGRLLGTIYINKLNVNNWMIENNYGYVYNGGTKKI